jgi:hypothetical protein
MVEAHPGDLLIGALGRRSATLEAVGSFEAVGDDRIMHALTGAGLFGRLTSVAVNLGPLVRTRYQGHVHAAEQRIAMGDFVRDSDATLEAPVVLVVGTSMSAGKTATCGVLASWFRSQGMRAVGAKLTGAGRYRDILAMRDRGAVAVYDFVDAGLPSSICPEGEYRERLRSLLRMVGSSAPDVVVAEAGASPLEPYNGGTAIEELGDRVACLVLAAADPYSVVGIEKAFNMRPDAITGRATSTDSACELVESLAGIPAINVLDTKACPRLFEIVAKRLGMPHD